MEQNNDPETTDELAGMGQVILGIDTGENMCELDGKGGAGRVRLVCFDRVVPW